MAGSGLGLAFRNGAVDFTVDNKEIFGNLETKSAVNIIDFKHIDSLNPELINQITENGGQVVLDQDKASAQMSVTATTGSKAVRQTRHLNYQSGKAFRVSLTGAPFIAAIPTDTKWEYGLFDDADDKDLITYPNQYEYGNGLFFRYLNGWSFVVRSSATGAQVDNVIPQSSWNGDKLDGTGDSGITLDPNGINIFWIEFGWLSKLGFRFGVYNGPNQKVIAHVQSEVDNNPYPYMSRATLPISMRLENVGGDAAASFMTCGTAESIGGYSPTGVQYYVPSSRTATTAVTSTPTPLLTIRLKQPFNKRSFQILKNEYLSTNNGNVLTEVVVNPVWTTAPTGWADIPFSPGSGMEYSTNGVLNLAAGGRVQNGGGLSNNTDSKTLKPDSIFLPSSNVDGKPDEFCLFATVIGSGTEQLIGQCTWKEFI